MSSAGRKSYSRIADIPGEVLASLNRGDLESATLAEGLAIDFALLFSHAFPSLPPLGLDAGAGVTRRMTLAAQALPAAVFENAAGHPSDTVRGWAAHWIGLQEFDPAECLVRIRPFAADRHFGVREWAWLAIRPRVAASLPGYLELLIPWTADADPNIRRFASELTRPRGVWCAHLTALRQEPALALPILEPLKSDSSGYVQDSVANWLNDASKDQPKWVSDLAKRWRRDSKSPETARILKRGLRSLESATPPKRRAAR